MRRLKFVLMMLVLLGVVGSSGLFAQEGGPQTLLQVVDTVPFTGQELGLESEIAVYFDRALNCDSVVNAVMITPAVRGDLACAESDTALIFNPAEAYARSTTYTLEISQALTAQDGSQLLEPFTFEVNTVGYLQVSEVFPSPSIADVQTDSVITVIFNRPVVPLSSVDDLSTLPNPLVFNPAVSGKGEWLNTSIYVFRPETAFSGGTQYTVSINAGLSAVDGSILRETYSWSFRTVFPEIISISPESQSSNLSLKPKIQVRFNQPMDRASVEANFFLRPQSQLAGSLAGSFEWAEDDAGFRFEPSAPLQIDTLYVAGFNSGAAYEKTRQAALTGMVQWNYVTVPAPAIISTDPRNGAENVPPYGGFTLYFASPMDQKTLKDKITIEPKPYRDPDYYYYEYGSSLSVSFPTEPSTRYTITIAPGMADPYGNTIDQPLTFSYQTGGYSPDVRMQVPGAIGFYSAYREETQLFITHLNVKRLDLSLYQIPLNTFVSRASDDRYYYDAAYDFSADPANLLKRWQIQANVPENVFRYELLNLGSADGTTSAGVSCPAAPATRLKVGDTAVVITEPDPVRARATPPSGEILELLYKGYSMPIVGGPVCANDILWWEVELRDSRRVWVAEGLSDEYFLDLRIASATTPVDVNTLQDGPLEPGVYFLEVSSPETAAIGYRPLKHFLVVSTANLIMKSSINSVTVWATDVQTGKPIPNAPISIYDPAYTVVGQGVTNADGIVTIPVPRVNNLYELRSAVLQMPGQFGLSIGSWTDGIEAWSFGQSTNYFPYNHQVYIYTDRPIYRPGQPVYFRGIVRLRDDVKYTQPNMTEVPVQIFNDQNELIYEQNLPLTPFGTFTDKFELSADASLGNYYLSVQLPSVSRFSSEGGSVSFTVGEFRVPEFQTTVTPQESEVVQGDTIKVTVDSKYFFGGPVSNATVVYNVLAEDYYFRYTGKGYYEFGDFNYDGGPGDYYGSSSGLVASGEGITDGSGLLTIEVPADLKNATQSQTFTIEATVSDESQQAVSGRTRVIVHQGLVYIGARPTDYVGLARQESSFEIISVDWNSNPVPNQRVEVQVVERRWSSVQEEDEFGRTTWTWDVEEIPVTQGDVVTDSQGKALYTYTPPNGGIFKLIITSRDAGGNALRASSTMWVSSLEYVSWRQQNSNRIDLIVGQTHYNIGETAEILITSPFQGTTEAFITVERNGVLMAQRVTMESNSYVLQLPIEADYAPNVFVSVVLVKGVDETNPVAAFRMGLTQLTVDTARKVMDIEITPDRERAGPRETVRYTIRTTDYKGDPVSAEVGVAVTDLASLSIIGPNSGPLLDTFYGLFGLGVRTSTPLTINTDQLTQTTLDTIKGGGGGFGAFGITEIREDFIDTPYWNGAVVTNANGEATIDVLLPDQLTTWRLDARGITKGDDGVMLVGQTVRDLISTKPLLIRPVTPRFFVVGDKMVLSAVVNNNSGEALSVDVGLQATGVTLGSSQTQTFVIEDGARQRIIWNVTVDDVENIDLTFFARAKEGQFSDASKPALGQGEGRLLPVYKYEAPETVGTAGVLRAAGSRTEAIVLPRRFDVTQGELTVSLQTSLAGTTLDGLDYLRNFPHQCIEQTISRFLPNIITYRALKRLGVADAELETELNRAAQFALQRLYAGQKVDGGWGWFVQDRSSPLTTAYALIGLVEARDYGFVVDPSVITRAQGYLRTQFIVADLSVETWRLNQQAFLLYALAYSGGGDVARTVNLFDNRENLSIYAKAFLAMTLNYLNPNDATRTDVLLSELLNSAIFSATGTHWDESTRDYWNWNTDTRTTAIVLQALIKLRPQSDIIPNVVRYLMVQRRADAWETTQETAWAVMGLTNWMVVSGELDATYDYSAALNGLRLGEGSASRQTSRDTQKLVVDVAELLKGQVNNLLIGRTGDEGALYYTAHLRVFLPVPEIQPLNRGIIVERRYTLLGDESETSITQARVGDVVQVRLTIIVPNALHYVVIEDPLPAGAEAINPNLEISQQIGTRPGLDRKDPLSRGWGWWWFSNIEFRDEKVVLYSTYLPAGTYEYVYTMRPGIEGTYNVIPATGQEFYFPEVYGRSAGAAFTILPPA